MKKKLFFFLGIAVIFSVSAFFAFYHPLVECKYDFLPITHCKNIDSGIDIIKTKEMAFSIAKKIWTEEYGFRSILFTIFDCRLENDRYWIFEGRKYFHILFRSYGGGPYIILEKNGKVVALGYTG